MFSYSTATAADESSDRGQRSALPRSELDQWKWIGAGVLGGALVAFGLRRRSLGGAALALVGAWLSYRAISGGFGDSAESQTVEEAITVGEPAEELSEFAHEAGTLERIVGPFADVSPVDEESDRHRWTVGEPLDQAVSWEMDLADDSTDERLRWEPVDDNALIDDWLMEFREAPGDRGTEVILEITFAPPGGVGNAAIDRLDVVPESLVGTALDRFKSLAETGEIPTTEGNPSGRGRGDLA